MSILDRFPRRSLMYAGPLDGASEPLPIPDAMPWPRYRCHRDGRGPWHHYALDDTVAVTGLTATYRYAGECTRNLHDGGGMPHDHDSPDGSHE